MMFYIIHRMRLSRPLLVAAFLALAFGASSAEAACSAAPTANTTDGLLSFATNPPAYGQVSGIPVADGALVYDSTTKLFKYCDGTTWVTLGATGTAAGSTGYVQFNTSGSLDSDANFYWDKTNDRLRVGAAHTHTDGQAVFNVRSEAASNTHAVYIESGDSTNSKSGLFVYGRSSSQTGPLVRISSYDSGGFDLMRVASGEAYDGTGGTTRFVIGASGNVGIGTTTPDHPLSVWGTDTSLYASSSSALIGPQYAASTTPTFNVFNRSTTSGTGAYLELGALEAGNKNNIAYIGAISNAGVYTPTIVIGQRTGTTAYAERMRIDSNGNVGIGTTTPGASLDVYGGTSEVITNIRNSAGVLSFASGITNPTYGNYIAGLTASGAAYAGIGLKAAGGPPTLWVHTNGNVGVGTTGPAEQLTVSTTSNVDKLGIYNFGTGKGNGVVFQPFADDAKVFSFRNAAATEVGSIVIKSTSTLYNAASDRRLKENIVDTTRGLAEVMRLGVKDFNFMSDPKKERVQGFIAQDFYKVYPEAVQVGGDDPKEHPWQVDYGRLTPLLVKAIQELKADNDNLRRDLAATEHRLEVLEQAQPDSRPREKRSH